VYINLQQNIRKIDRKIMQDITWSLVVAANSEDLLRKNLLQSREVELAKEIVIKRDAFNIGKAYNAGLAECTAEIVVFAHQDVYLPAGWTNNLYLAIKRLTLENPNWGVVGTFGMTAFGNGAGYVYSTGLRGFVGQSFINPIQVRTLDEMLLILRRSAGLSFDEELPGFHLYGTDICLEAENHGLKNFVVPCFTLHNSRGIKRLPLSFWRAYWYLRSKWKDRLPIQTPCTNITKGYMPIIEHILWTCWSSIQNKNNPGSRVNDTECFYNEHVLPSLGK
jgi:hypothetical protein